MSPATAVPTPKPQRGPAYRLMHISPHHIRTKGPNTMTLTRNSPHQHQPALPLIVRVLAFLFIASLLSCVSDTEPALSEDSSKQFVQKPIVACVGFKGEIRPSIQAVRSLISVLGNPDRRIALIKAGKSVMGSTTVSSGFTVGAADDRAFTGTVIWALGVGENSLHTHANTLRAYVKRKNEATIAIDGFLSMNRRESGETSSTTLFEDRTCHKGNSRSILDLATTALLESLKNNSNIVILQTIAGISPAGASAATKAIVGFAGFLFNLGLGSNS